MKFNIKSRKGFTLIELLVVIGILAVLAAIAIPSVAGLIDRANQSSDKTNSNEMTNAIERFASEYELYCQDIASGVIKDTDNDGKPDDMDAAQGRVYNVTKVKDRSGIEGLEKDTTAGPTTTGRAIYRDTKYPVNAETLKAIVENYTKTSSSTFEPKQSDMHFWYSPECGVVVVAGANSSVADKNDMIISGMDAKGNPLNDDETNGTIWIDLTNSTNITPPADMPAGSVEIVHKPTGDRYQSTETITITGYEFTSGTQFTASEYTVDARAYDSSFYGPLTQNFDIIDYEGDATYKLDKSMDGMSAAEVCEYQVISHWGPGERTLVDFSMVPFGEYTVPCITYTWIHNDVATGTSGYIPLWGLNESTKTFYLFDGTSTAYDGLKIYVDVRGILTMTALGYGGITEPPTLG